MKQITTKSNPRCVREQIKIQTISHICSCSCSVKRDFVLRLLAGCRGFFVQLKMAPCYVCFKLSQPIGSDCHVTDHKIK